MQQDSKELIHQLKKTFNTVTTNRLSFRTMSRSDCFPLFNATRNEEFNKNLIWEQPDSEEALMNEVELLLKEDVRSDAVVLSITDKYKGTWIGLLKLTSYKDSVRFSIWMHPDYWNTRAAISSLETSIEIIFKYSDVNSVYARVKKDYSKVEKIIHKMGGYLLSTDSIPHSNGTVMHDCVYQLDKKDWKKEDLTISIL